MDNEIDKSIGSNKKKMFDPNSRVLNFALIAFGVLLLGGIVFLGLKSIGTFGGKGKSNLSHTITYRTQGKVELYDTKSTSANVRAVLKETTIVSGKSAGKVDGTEWVEVTSVDGAHGFVPINALQIVGEGADLSQVQDSLRRVVTSTSVNLRAVPSLSGAVVGYVDGGTRLQTDGYVSSQGEDWLRMRIGRDQTGFLMARFTTPDDDKSGNSEGFQSSKVGVPGTVKTVSNIQATPFLDGRVVKSIMEGDSVGVLGQTKTDDWWYIVRLDDGTQGFVPKSVIFVSEKLGKWVYPDGTEAPGPNIPKGQTKPVGDANSANVRQNRNVTVKRATNSGKSQEVSAQNPVKVDFNQAPSSAEAPPAPPATPPQQ